MFTKFLLVAAGGGLGASLRYGVILLLPAGGVFPYATLFANASGSLLAGIFVGIAAGTTALEETWRLFIVIGILSSFTTFSTFSVETMEYFLAGRYWISIANITFNFVLCLSMVYLGMITGRAFV